MEKRLYNVNVRLTNGELEMLKALARQYGGVSLPDSVRRCIEERFRKAFPLYVKQEKSGAVMIVTPEKDLSDEQFCEKYGGKIVKGEAGPLCEQTYPNGVSKVRCLASDREMVKAYSKQIAAMKVGKEGV